MSRRSRAIRHSLLNWMRRMLAVRQPARAFGRGALRFLYPQNRKVLAYLRELRRRDDPVRRQRLAHAAGGRARPVGIRRPRAGRAERRLAVPADRPAHLSADPAALRLLLVHPRQRGRSAVAGTRRRPNRCPNIVTVVLRNRLDEALTVRPRSVARARGAAALSAKRRWFAAKDQALQSAAASPIRAAAGRGPRRAAGRDRGHDRAARRSRWLLPLVDASGKTSRAPPCRPSWRWRACAAAGASAC